jgi:hypothetical protein
MAPRLAGYVQQNPKFALLKVDIKSWKSPVAAQFSIKSVPYLQLYDVNGNLVAEGTNNVLKYLK